MKSEVIIQKSHRVGYDHAIRNCGVKMIEVETLKELEAAISERTAMMWFYNNQNPVGKIKDVEFVGLGKKHGIPTFNDCAAECPPAENLWKWTQMGFDLVAFSGGKGLRGPQSAGLLLGKKDLIIAARKNAPPNGSTVGRGMKVNKEEILGMLVALEVYLARDHQKDRALWEKQIKLIHDAIASVPGTTPEIHVPEIANHVPSLRIKWDASKIKITPEEVRNALRNGHPSIETMGGNETVDITTWMMIPGEERMGRSRAAKNPNLFTRSPFKLSYLILNIAADNFCVGERFIMHGSGENNFGHFIIPPRVFNVVFTRIGLVPCCWPIVFHHLIGYPSIQSRVPFVGPLADILEHFFVHFNPVHFPVRTSYKTVKG